MRERPFIRQLPKYGQFHNGCGLSSLLMLLEPPHNTPIRGFLNQFWGILKGLYRNITHDGIEYHWAIVLQYLLLKYSALLDEEKLKDHPLKEEINDFFVERLSWDYDDIKFINKEEQEIQRSKFMNDKRVEETFTYTHYLEGDDLLTPVIVVNNLHHMKTDMELRLLAEIFNFKFFYQQGDDITGAITFLEGEVRKKKLKDHTKQKWESLEKISQDRRNIILYGRAHHWMAVRGVYREFQLIEDDEKRAKIKEDKKWDTSKMIIECNNPADSSIIKMTYRKVNLTDRFVIFQNRNESTKYNNNDPESYPVLAKLIEILKKDIILEKEIFQIYINKKSGSGQKQFVDKIVKRESNSQKSTNKDFSIPNDVKNKIKNFEVFKDNKRDREFLKMLDDDDDDDGEEVSEEVGEEEDD